MDLIMSYKHKKRQISVTRNCKELTAMTSVSMVDQRSIVWYVRITCFSILFIYHIFSKLQVFKLNCAGVLEVISSSGWRHLTFNPDEEKIIIQIDRTKSRTETRANVLTATTVLTHHNVHIITLMIMEKIHIETTLCIWWPILCSMSRLAQNITYLNNSR